MTSFLGIDTSNYTTSAACCRADGSGYNSSQLLTVKSGELGLRQNEALFQHIKNLPQRFAELREAGFLQDIAAVGASTQPRAVEGSYMPCFLAGGLRDASWRRLWACPSTPSLTSRGILPPSAGQRRSWSC